MSIFASNRDVYINSGINENKQTNHLIGVSICTAVHLTNAYC